MEDSVSSISAEGLVFTICLGILLLVLPRRYALAPLLFAGSYMTLGQYLVIGGYHFHIIRMLIAFGFIRILIRREFTDIEFNSIDFLFVSWLVISSLLYVLLSGDTALFNLRLGRVYNGLGIYFLVRASVRDLDDIVHLIKIFAAITIPLAVPFFIEYASGRNPFFILGGVPEFSQVRDGRPRCQGPFLHPILVGTFAATAVPLFVGLWAHSSRYRLIALGSILTATFIVIVSSSSGPVLAYLGIVVGFSCWIAHEHMRKIRWGIVILLVALHLIMKSPVWYLISRVSEIVGGSGWYRSALIDAFFTHFDEWWLIGTSNTAHWMPTGISVSSTMTDIVNHYVAQGVNGGLLSLVLFIWMIVRCFKAIGDAAHNEEYYAVPERFMIWSLGCGLLGHVVSFFSVSYFDQINIFWYLNVGMAAALATSQDQVVENEISDPAPPYEKGYLSGTTDLPPISQTPV